MQMTRRFVSLASLFLGVFFAGCNDKSPSAPKDAAGHYRAQVLVFDSASTQSDEATTAFQVKEVAIESLQDLESLSGAYFEILEGGQLFIQDIAGSQVQSDKFTGGGKPRLRYTMKDGVIVPRDYNTLLLLSAYYQFETVWRSLKGVTGFTPEAFLASMGKFRIMFEPKIRIETDDSTLDATIKLNAAFVPGKQQFILFQRSNLEKVPLAANLQVIAHEFGHALFEKTFFENKFSRCEGEEEVILNRTGVKRFAQEFAITGINEGFADVISWGVTGSTDILRSSIDLGDSADERNFASEKFTFSSLGSNDDEVCSGRFYCIGSLFARSVRSAALGRGVNTKVAAQRQAVTTEVVTAVSKVQASLRTFDTGLLPAPSVDVAGCSTPSNIDLTYDGKITGAFLAAFLKNVPPANRASYCTAFKKTFGAEGFPTAVRGDCP
ncbi:MAG: hypothetical protein IOD12_02990 [Silvanigrellales bacterium]|nr:hypothetical protein [Silvanigrellales bacterium]